MNKLPMVSGKECVSPLSPNIFAKWKENITARFWFRLCRVRALEKAGFYLRRQEGSHMVMRRDDPFAQVVVPDHKELDRGTLRAIIRQAGLNVSEFIELL